MNSTLAPQSLTHMEVVHNSQMEALVVPNESALPVLSQNPEFRPFIEAFRHYIGMVLKIVPDRQELENDVLWNEKGVRISRDHKEAKKDLKGEKLKMFQRTANDLGLKVHRAETIQNRYWTDVKDGTLPLFDRKEDREKIFAIRQKLESYLGQIEGALQKEVIQPAVPAPAHQEAASPANGNGAMKKTRSKNGKNAPRHASTIASSMDESRKLHKLSSNGTQPIAEVRLQRKVEELSRQLADERRNSKDAAEKMAKSLIDVLSLFRKQLEEAASSPAQEKRRVYSQQKTLLECFRLVNPALVNGEIAWRVQEISKLRNA